MRGFEGLLRHHPIIPPLHLLGGEVLLLHRHEPHVPERILDGPRAIAVELILERPDDLRARLDRAREHGVGVVDVEVQLDGRAADRRGAERAEIRVLVGDHEYRAADVDLGVADLSARLGEAHRLAGAERLPVELDRPGRVLAADVRREALHGFLPSMRLIMAGVGTVRVWRSPARSTSVRKSASVRSRPPVTTIMFRSEKASMLSIGDVPGRSGTIGSTMRSTFSGVIAAAMLRRTATLFSSSQSWMTLLMM